MARITLDIPADKMNSFLQMILQLGIDKSVINARYTSQKPRTKKLFSKFHNKFLLFDWEFYNNELEFE